MTSRTDRLSSGGSPLDAGRSPVLPRGSVKSNHLIVFLKAPRSGQVKTRLAQSVGVATANRIYYHLVEVLLSGLRKLPEIELRFTPDEARMEIQPWLRDTWTARPQGTGDLGSRLSRAFAESFGRGAARVVIIGSDCPEILPQDVFVAWDVLGTRDVVLGPAADGGYWLIGLRQWIPDLFAQMRWSVPTVFEETCRRAASAGLQVHILGTLADVDTEGDWHSYLARRNKSPA